MIEIDVTKIVVLGYPRTGATLVKRNLEEHWKVPVDQTHFWQYRPMDSNYTAVITQRRDVFSAICSYFIMHHTGEMVDYTNKKTDRFEIDPITFHHHVSAYRDFYDKLDLSCYNHVIHVFYEDLVSDPSYLFGSFAIDRDTDYNIIKASPYRADQLISNYNKLKKMFANIPK